MADLLGAVTNADAGSETPVGITALCAVVVVGFVLRAISRK